MYVSIFRKEVDNISAGRIQDVENDFVIWYAMK